MSFLERAIRDGHAQIAGEGKNAKITYIAVNRTERYSDPEEPVRAEFWAEESPSGQALAHPSGWRNTNSRRSPTLRRFGN